MQTLKVNVTELRVGMARANIKPGILADRAGIHRNTIYNILKSKSADLDCIGVLTFTLSQFLQEAGYPPIGPFSLLMVYDLPEAMDYVVQAIEAEKEIA